MIIRKRRGKNELMPIKIYSGEYNLAMRLGMSIEEYVKAAVLQTAKERRWKWYFENRGMK